MAEEEAAEGTNFTLLRLIPAPNTLWSCSGISYVSSSDIAFVWDVLATIFDSESLKDGDCLRGGEVSFLISWG